MTINVNIAIIVITMLFQCSTTLASDNELWFPKEFNTNKSIECGLDHEMFGLSLVDGYLFQFEKCAVIIYPPPLDKYLDKELNQLKLENGYRYTFEEIQPNWKPNYCEYTKASINSPWLILTHLKSPNNSEKNHILLYFIALLIATGPMHYYTYDFDLHKAEVLYREIHRKNSHYILLTKGDEQFIIHNSVKETRYELIGDPIIRKDHISYDYICIRKTDNKNYFISRIEWDQCDQSNVKLTHSLLKSIVLSFTVYEKILMISKRDNKVLITDVAFLHVDNNTIKEYSLQVKSLKDFFYRSKYKSDIWIFIILALIIVIIITGIVVFMIPKKKNIKKSFDKMNSKSSSKITDTTTATTITSKTIK